MTFTQSTPSNARSETPFYEAKFTPLFTQGGDVIRDQGYDDQEEEVSFDKTKEGNMGKQ